MSHLVIGHGFPLLGLSTRFFLSRPATMRSMAAGSLAAPQPAPCAASRSALLRHEIGQISAGKAGGQRRHLFQSTPWARVIFLTWTFRISRRLSCRDGPPAPDGRSDRHEARLIEDFGAVGGGEDDQPDRAVKPSISVSNWFSVCSRSSCPRSVLRHRVRGPKHPAHQ